ncbi:MAG: fusaric acid resistance protein [Rhizobiales bacterium 65-79]|nr:MAG: fusaric acid resistance protein [Rhizobiales bacterium 65-79]
MTAPSWPDTLHSWLARIPPPKRSDWIFAVRATIAGLVALSIAYALKLENPQWAMMTVFIVAQPVAGMVLAKGFFRLAGTVVGALAALLLVWAGRHGAPAFLAALAVWIGLCTFAASLLRNPESYGAALAGYTAAIISLPAFNQPHLAHELAVARASEIALGIVCAGLASRLFLPQLARDQIVGRLEGLVRDLAAYAEFAFGGADRPTLVKLNRRIIAETQALGEMRAYVRLEGPSLAAHGRSVRRTIGYLLSAHSAARMLRLHAAPPNPALPPTRSLLKEVVHDVAERPDALDDVAAIIARLRKIAADARQASLPENVPDRIGAAARLAMAAEFADALAGVLDGLDAVRHPGRPEADDMRQPALVIHRDRQTALRNAVRAALATSLVAAFWIATQWADAAGATIIVAVVSSLFASRPAPIRTSFGFFKGTLLAVPFAFIVGQLLLPAFPGFFWFVLFVVPVLIPAALAMANPTFTGTATAFAINFLAFLSPHQQMVYAPTHFLNQTASILVGILLSIGVFWTVLPARPRDSVLRIVATIKEDLVRLCLHERVPRRSAFESLAYDRINQLMPFAQRTGSRGEAMLSASVAAVTVGLEVLVLRNAEPHLPDAVKPVITGFLKRLASLILRPTGSHAIGDFAAATRAEAEALGARGDASQPVLAVAAALRVIAAAVEDNPRFFRDTRSGPRSS